MISKLDLRKTQYNTNIIKKIGEQKNMKNTFIKAGESLINLKNTTNIAFLSEKKRIIFNLNSSVESDKQKNKGIQLVSDYRYWNFETFEAYEESKQKLLIIIGNNEDEWLVYEDKNCVNINFITHVKVDSSYNRIIINLCNSITKDTRLGKDSITNDFVFWTFDDYHEFIEVYDFIESKLTNI